MLCLGSKLVIQSCCPLTARNADDCFFLFCGFCVFDIDLRRVVLDGEDLLLMHLDIFKFFNLSLSGLLSGP
jgi:hypothetical protein